MGRYPQPPDLLVSPHSFYEGRFQSVGPLMASHMSFFSPRKLSEEESPFPPISILFLLACIFLSKLLAASALWAAAWHGQKRRTPHASGLDCGHDPGYQLQTLTGELGEHGGGWGLVRWG